MAKYEYDYVLKMEFMTDGDYCWDTVVPRGFNFDGNETFTFEMTFYSYEKLKDWAEKNIPIFKQQFFSRDNDLKERILSYFDSLMEAILNDKEYYKTFEANDEEKIYLQKVVKGYPVLIHISEDIMEKINSLGTAYTMTIEENILNILNSNIDYLKNSDINREKNKSKVYYEMSEHKDKNNVVVKEGDILKKDGFWDLKVNIEEPKFVCESADKVRATNGVGNMTLREAIELGYCVSNSSIS